MEQNVTNSGFPKEVVENTIESATKILKRYNHPLIPKKISGFGEALQIINKEIYRNTKNWELKIDS